MENHSMMTSEECTLLIKQINTMYPHTIDSEVAANMWGRALRDIPYKVLENALLLHIQSSRFAPTISELRSNAARLMPHERTLSDMEAWGMVMKAIRRANYYAEEEYDKLPAMVQKAVGDPVNLREWAVMPSDEVQSVGQSQFLRAYRTLQQREEADAGVSPALQILLDIAEGNSPKRLDGGNNDTL